MMLCRCGCGEAAKGFNHFILGHNLWIGPEYVEDPETGCWLWQRRRVGRGYGERNVDGQRMSAHRYAYEQAYGPIPEGHHVHHACHVKHCVNPAHLELVVPQIHGLLHSGAKLTQEIADEIRQRTAMGARGVDLAREFGVARSTISNVRAGRHWA